MTTSSKTQNVLRLLTLLASPKARSSRELCDALQCNERTLRRYLSDLKNLDEEIYFISNGSYQLNRRSSFIKDIWEQLYFSQNELECLYKALLAIEDENPLKKNLQEKLFRIYDYTFSVPFVGNPEHAELVNNLVKARYARKKVLLKQYHSANSNQIRDRRVEPFAFTTNYVTVWAYDVEDKTNKVFKIARIRDVEILSEPWEFAEYHKEKPLDAFRISADEEEMVSVKLKLSLRAAGLLQEEYPNAEANIQPADGQSFYFEDKVAGYEGVGRFVLSLPGEIEIVYPEELKKFVREKVKKYLADSF